MNNENDESLFPEVIKTKSSKSRKSFFRSLNELKSEKMKFNQLESDGVNHTQNDHTQIDDDFTDSDDDGDVSIDELQDNPTPLSLSNDGSSMLNQFQHHSNNLNSNESLNESKLKCLYPLLEHIAFDKTSSSTSSLKDVCGDWRFIFQDIEIHDKISYASLEEWSLAVMFRYMLKKEEDVLY